MKNLFLLSLALFATLLVVSAPFAQTSEDEPDSASFKVIVHKSNPYDALTRSQVSSYLLKKKPRWKDGRQVDPVDLDSRSEIRADMSQLIHGRSVASIKNYWQRQIFSGHNTPPPELPDDQSVLDFVKGNPGSIGYVAADAVSDGVKELRIVD